MLLGCGVLDAFAHGCFPLFFRVLNYEQLHNLFYSLPRSYFFNHFGFYGAFEFLSSDNENDYVSALHDYPKSSPAVSAQ